MIEELLLAGGIALVAGLKHAVTGEDFSSSFNDTTSKLQQACEKQAREIDRRTEEYKREHHIN